MHKGGKMNQVAFPTKSGTVRPAMLVSVAAAAMLMLGVFSVPLFAGILQISFPSAEEAVRSLVAAVRANDMDELRIILGPGSETLI